MPNDAGAVTAAEPRSEPGWLETARGPLFCWYHAPAGPVRREAVLLCDPIGPDRMNLHLTYRALALKLSEAGFAVLRFDYRGTGDSSGSPRDEGWAEGWESDARAAAAHLLERSGADSLAVFGARFGGTLATSLAASHEKISSLVLWGPYLQGRSFLRSERALSLLVQSEQNGRATDYAKPGDKEYLGYVYSASALAHIDSYRLIENDRFHCRRAKIIAWEADSGENSLAALLSDRGVEVDFDRPEGYLSDDSLRYQSVPEPLLSDVVDWLVGGQSDGDYANPSDAGSDGSDFVRMPSVEGRLALRAEVDRGEPRAGKADEEAVFLGPDSRLFGILSLGKQHPSGGVGPGLILVNGGNNHRPGINRNYTEWARNAALAGFTTLRFDIRGLGDSPPLAAEHLNELYRDETREDVLAAIDFLSSREDCRGVVLCGLCAGAYQALAAARADRRVTGLILLDLLRWDKNESPHRNRGFWDRRRRGVLRRVRQLSGLFPARAQPPRTKLAEGLGELVGRGVEVVLVSCLKGGGYELVSEAIESDRESLEASGRFRLEIARDTNHIFSHLWAQDWLATQLDAFLAKARRRDSTTKRGR